MTDLTQLGAGRLLEGFAAGDFTPTEVVGAVFDRIARLGPGINAFSALEHEHALRSAEASTARWRRGGPVGALDGVPVTVKENVATAGLPRPGGMRAGAHNPPDTVDGPAAASIEAAGGVRVGKTVMPDMGMLSSGVSSLHGITRSPWNPDWSVGGSSGGAAAAAVAGFGVLHVGSDIGGSVRLPASWTGIATLKPSFGLIPVDPPYMGRCIGAMARTVDDVALLTEVMARPSARDYTNLGRTDVPWGDFGASPLTDGEMASLRVGVHLDAGAGTTTAPEVRAAVETAVGVFTAAGAVVEEIPPFLTPEAFRHVDRFLRARSWLDVSRMGDVEREGVLPFVVAWSEGGAHLTGTDVIDSYQQIQSLRAATVAATLPYDVVLSPVAPMATFPAEWPMPSNDPEHSLDHCGFTVPYNFSEQPAASVNAGFTDDGRPVGVQISGRRFDDVRVLQVAKWFESRRGAAADPVWPS